LKVNSVSRVTARGKLLEHAVDLETGAVLAVTLQPATDGDTKTVHETLAQCGESICEVAAETNNEKVGERVNPEGPAEAVLDEGYHFELARLFLQQRLAIRSYDYLPYEGQFLVLLRFIQRGGDDDPSKNRRLEQWL
jgi:hypothetical protein